MMINFIHVLSGIFSNAIIRSTRKVSPLYMIKTSTRSIASGIETLSAKKVWYFSLFLMMFSFAMSPIGASAEGTLSKKHIEELVRQSQNSISFIENKGQWPGSVKMRGSSSTGEILIKDDNIHFLSYKKEEHEEEHEGEEEHEEEYEVEVHQWAIFFEGMNKKYSTIRKNELPTKRNYYLGDDKSLYQTNVTSYGEVVMADIYQGIDLRLYSQQAGLLEFDWVVDAGADYKNIRMRFKGPDKLSIDEQGRLCIGLEFNTIKFNMPECYQVINGKKQLLRFRFDIGRDNVVTFVALDKVDNNYALVIDPDLRWGTLFDGNNNTIFDEYLFATDVDNQGNVYCGGAVNLQFTNTYIATALYGYDPTYNGPGTGGSNTGNRDGILYKISEDGTEVTNITYFGSTNQDVIYGLSLSPDKSTVFVTGKSNGAIPTAGTAATSFDAVNNTGYDGFVAAFNASTFSNLLYSTYIGSTGSTDEEIVTVRALSNNSYVIGGRMDGALGSQYISNAYDPTFSNNDEGYIAKFQNWNSLVFGTYVGGASNDQINDLSIFSDGAIAFSGWTESTSNFPTLVNGASSNGNNRDGIVGVIPANGGNFTMLSRIGGSSSDEFYGLTIGFNDTIFLTGYTNSTNFPLGTGASAANRYDISHNGNQDALLAKIPRTGKTTSDDPWVATFFGGGGNDRANTAKRYTPLAIMVYGETQSDNLPTQNLSSGGSFFRSTRTGGWDMFFVTLGNDLKTLYYSTYAGGTKDDYIGETGDPRGSNHMFIVGDSLVGVGTTTHSENVNTYNPTLIGPRTGTTAVFDFAKATDDDSHLVFEWRLLNNFFNFDFGDAPASYGTPKHGILPNLRLGTKVDNEDFFPAAPGRKADYDDNNTTVSITDDEDAINASQVLVRDSATSYSINVAVTNTTGSVAYASAWIDFNKNGTFENSELSKVNVANNATSVTFNWASISGWSAGLVDTSFMRIRITQDPSFNVTFPSATTDAQTGEVEDYLVIRFHCVDLSAAVINTTNPTTCLGSNGSITIQNSNLLPGVTYTVYYKRNNGALQGPFSLTTANGGIFTIPNLQAGSYTTIQVFHPTNPLCGDTLTGPITLVDPTGPAAPVVTATPNPICATAAGNTLSLTATGAAGATYSWTGPNGYTSAAQNPTILITNTNQGGAYNVVQTLNGCLSPQGTVNVTVNATPATPTPSSNTPVCTGQTLNLSATGTGSTGYSWTGPNSFSSSLQNPSIAGVTSLAAGTYTVRQTVNGCQSAPATTSVVINAAPVTPTASSNTPCVGDNLNLTTATVSGATYSWTGPSGYTSAVQNPVRASATLAFAGTYNVFVTVSGCTSPAGSVVVTVNPLPTITSAVGANPTTCTGTNGSITLNGNITAGQSYTVTYQRNTVNQTATITANGSAQIVISGLNAGSYTNFRITNVATGCQSATFAGPVVITDPTSPATPTATNNGPVCAGDTIKLFTPTVSGATYSWSGPSFTSALQNPIILSATTGNAGSYSVAITVNNCTSAPGSTAVVVNSLPTISSANGTNPTTCSGSQGFITFNGSFTSGQQYSLTYQRNSVNQGPITLTVNGSNQLVLSGLSAGSYANFRLQLISTGCLSAVFPGPVTLTDPTTPAAPVATSNSPVCEGDTIKLFASNVSGATYSWSGPSFSSTTQNPIILSASLGAAGTYSVVAIVNGCTSPAGTVSVVVNPLPVITNASGTNPTTCGGAQGTIVLSGLVNGVQYTINYQRNSVNQSPVVLTAAGGQVTLTGLNAGTYTNFRATRIGTGCISAPFFGPVTLTDPSTPFPPSLSSNSPRCYGDTIKITASTVVGATYSWTGPNGYSSAVQSPVIAAATPAMSGTYSVVVTANNCPSVPATVNVVVNSCPPVAVDDAYTTPEDVVLTVPTPGVLVNDNDPANPQQPLTVTPTPVCSPKHGGVVLAGNGSFVYTPALNYNGKDTFCYRVCDNEVPVACDTAIVVITITPVNDPPVVPDTLVTTPEDVPKVICVPITDPEIPGQTHLVTVCGAPTKGLISSPATINNPFVPRSLCLTYTPNTNFNGLDSICLVICDNGTPILCDTSKIRITVTPLNDPPVAVDDYFTTPRNIPVGGGIRINDSDPDAGDTLAVTQVTTPKHGTVTVSSTGIINYIPTTNFFGVDSFRYSVCDRGVPAPVLCDTATVYITVNYINYPPLVPDTTVRVPEDSTITICAPIFDVDDSIQNHTFTVCGAPVNGIVTSGPSINNPGIPRSICLTYKPNVNYNGRDSICLVVCDNGTPALCDTTKIRIIVDPVNDKPVAINDTFNIIEDQIAVGNIRNNDSDPDAGDTLTVTQITTPLHGTVTVSTNGGIVYTPNSNFFGTDSFIYRVCDKGIPSPVLCDTATVYINVTQVNDPPVVRDTTVTTNEDTPKQICVPILDNDVADSHNATILQNTLHGTLSAGSVNNSSVPHSFCTTYTPDPNYNGNDSFKIVVCDNGLPVLCDTATIRIIIVPVNDPPVAIDDFFNGPEDDPIAGTVITNDSDPDSFDIITVTTTPICSPKNGSLVLNSNGTFVYDPIPNFNGNDTFCYRICDNGTPVLCDTAKVYISLNNVNDPPLAVDDRFTTPEDVVLNGSMKPNDIDPDGDSLVYATTPVVATGPYNGSVVINPNGTFAYTPNLNYNGRDSFQYSVCDNGTPVLCDTATVFITITPVNDKPIIPDSTVTTPENTPITVCLPITDPEAFDSHIGSVCSLPLHGSFGVPVVNNSSNPHSLCIIYTPNPGYSGKDSFCVQVCDNGFPSLCDIGIITINIAPINHKPDAVNDIYTTKEDSTFTSNVRGNDTDPDFGTGDTLTITQLTTPLHGTVSPVSSTGTFAYTPNANYNGVDSFRYVACDKGIPAPVLCDTATVIITILPVNDKPFIPDTLVTTPEGTPKPVCLPITDLEIPTDVHIASICGGPLNGTVTPAAPSGPTVNNPFDPRSLCLTYTPNTGFRGLDSICVIVCDNGIPSLCDTATIRINVTPVNHPPVAVNDAYGIAEDSTFTANVRTNDTDPDYPNGDTLTITQLTNPLHGTTTGLSSTGTFTYTANTNFTGVDSFRYVACDKGIPAPVLCDTATVYIVIEPVNDKPFIPDTLVTTPQGTPKTVCLPITDTELPTDIHFAAICGGPLNGTITASPIVNNPFVPRSLCLTYTPDASFRGLDSICVIVCDNGNPSLCDTATVRINVLPVNRPPDAVNNTYTINEDSTFTANIRNNDTDPDYPNGDTLTISQLTNPVHGTVTVSSTGIITYTPTLNYNGVDSFRYVACDKGIPAPVLCDTATVIITILPVNDKPFIPDTLVTTPEDTPITVCLPITDPEVTTQFFFPINCGAPLHGSITPLNVNNPLLPRILCATYTPTPNFNGLDSFCVIVCDNGNPSLCDTAIVTIRVTPVNDPPVAVNDVYTTPEDVVLNGNVRGNDTDPDYPYGDTLTITQRTTPLHGTVTVSPNGDFSYTPNLNFNGTDSFQYVACDKGIPAPVLCDTATVFITISPVNDPPVAVNDSASGNTNIAIPINVSNNDYDIDGVIVPSSTTVITTPAQGTVVNNGNGNVTYTSVYGYVGPDSFQYRICDNGLPILCDTATVYVNVIQRTITVTTNPVCSLDAAYLTYTLTSNNPQPSDRISIQWIGAAGNVVATYDSLPVTGTVRWPGAVVDANGNGIDWPGWVYNGTSWVMGADGFEGLNPLAKLVFRLNPTDTVVVNYPTSTPPTCYASPPPGPTAVNDSATTPEEVPVTVPVLRNDFDNKYGLDTTSVAVVTTPGHGTVTVNPNGTITYTPDSNYVGRDTFNYKVCNKAFYTLCDTATVYINVTPVNDPPFVPDTLVTTPEDTPVTVCVNIADIDVIDIHTAGICNVPQHGRITAGPTVNNGVLPHQFCYTYTPNRNFYGKDTVCIIVCDNGVPQLCDTSTTIITVIPVNDPPYADTVRVTTSQDVPVAVNTSSATGDPEGDPLTYTYGTPTEPGTIVTVTSVGGIVVTPPTGYTGTITIPYKVCDNAQYAVTPLCDSSVIIVTVIPSNPLLNHPPVANNDYATTNKNEPAVINVKSNDSDVDGDSLSVTISAVPVNGTVVVNANGTVTYTPNSGFVGLDTFYYVVCDPFGTTSPRPLCDEARVIVTINDKPNTSGNRPPAAVDDLATICSSNTVVLDLLKNDSDPDGDAITFLSIIKTPSNGIANQVFLGGYRYTPNSGFNGIDTFTYRICDNGTPSLCDTANAIIRVTSAPVLTAAPSSLTICSGDSVKIDITSVPSSFVTWTATNGTSGTGNVRTTLVNNGLSDIAVVYTFTGNFNGCVSTPITVPVTIKPRPQAAALPNANQVCSGSPVTIVMSSNFIGTSYTWTATNGHSGSGANIIDTLTNSGVIDSSVTYTVTPTFNGCSGDVVLVNVLVKPRPTITLGAAPDTICSNVQLTINVSSNVAGTSYSWTGSNGSTGFSVPVVDIPVNLAGVPIQVTYTINSTNGVCAGNSVQKTVVVNPRPQADGGPNATIENCPLSSVILGGSPTASGGTPPYTTIWSPAAGLNDSTLANPKVTGIAADAIYVLTVTDRNGCTATDVVNVTVVPSTLATEAGNNAAYCFGSGSSATLGGIPTAVGGKAPFTYRWYPALGLTDSTAANPTASPAATTKYFVETKDANGCTATDSVVITVNPVPVANAGRDTALCATFGTVIGGNPTASSGTGSYSYTWTPSAGLSANNIANPTAAPNITTTYNVVVRDSNGCTATDAVIITINPLPIANAGPDVTTTGCSSDSVQLGGTPAANNGTAPFTYLWQPSVSLSDTSIARPFVKGLGSSTLYSLLVTDSKGCTATDVVLVSVVPTNLKAEAGNNLRYCKGSNTIVTLGGTPTVTGGVAPFTYSWNFPLGNIANPLVGPDSTTTYVLTVTDAKGCSSVDSVTITVNPKPTANAGADSAICFNSPIRLGTEPVASGGTPLYTYLWSPGQGLSATTVSRPIATPTSTTTYSVLVTDANGCTNTDQITVTVRSRPVADAGPDKTLVACSSDSVQLGGSPSASSGTAPYSYLWAPTTGIRDSSLANPWVNSLGATTLYTLTVTDANGCTNTDQAVVIVTGSSLVVEAGNNAAFCAGTNGSAVLGGAPTVSGGTAPYTYVWSPDSSLNLTNITNPIASPITTTTYTVRVTDAKGCQASDTVRVTVYTTPTADAGVNDTICFGTSKILGGAPTATGGKSPYTYSWSPAGVTPANVANPTANPTGTTSYTVTVRDANGCSSTASTTVFVAPSLIADAGLNQSVTGCSNDSITLGGSPTATGGLGAYTYAWTPANGLSSTTVANPIVKGISSTFVYALTVTDEIGCTATDIVTVVYTPSTLRANAGEDTIICSGVRTGIQLGASATGGKAPYTYMWSPAAGLNNASIVNPIARPTSTTTYELLVTDGNGCTSIDSVTIRVNGQINLSVGADTAICLGSSVVLGGSDTVARGGTAPYTYSWTPSVGLSGASTAHPVATPSVTTTYILLVTDGVGCTAQTAQGVVVNPVPRADAGPDQSIVSCGAASVTLGGSPSASGGTPGYTYNWTPATALSNVASSNPVVDSLYISTNYTLVVTDINGCTATDAVFVNVIPTTLSADAGANRAICSADTAVGIVIGGIPTAIGGALPYTYTWSGAGLTGGNKANPVARPAVTTTYFVTVTDANACVSVDSIVIVVNDKPTAAAGNDTALCNTFGVTLGGTPTATGGTTPYTYSWTPGTGLTDASSSNPVATPASTTTYALLVTDRNGCTATDAVTVTIKQAPVADAGTDKNLVSCSSDSVTLGGSPTAKNGVAPYTYIWSPGGYTTANPVVKNLGATTTFEVTVTDNTGCTSTDQVVVNVSGSTLTVEAGNGGYICAGTSNSVQLGGIPTVQGGALPYKYIWTPNSGLNADTIANPIATPTITTKYTVLVTDANGCQASDTVVVSIRPKPVVDFTRDSTVCIDRGLVTLVGTPAGGTFTGTGVTGNSFQPTVGAGTYTITYSYTDGFGCSNSISKTITVDPLPVVDITGNNTFYCANEKADTLTGVPAGGKFTGTGVDSVGIFTPANGAIGNNVITYTYTNANGCTNSKTVTIEVRPAPTVNLVASDDSVCINVPVTLSATFSNNVFNLQWYDINGTYLQSGLAPITVTPTRMDHGYVVFGTNTVGCTTSDTVLIHVNQAPVAEADTANTCEEEPVFVDVVVNDSDLEGNANVLTIAAPAQNGTTTVANGVILYTPNPNYNGSDRFSYSICNTQCTKDCDTAFVLVNICSINDTPTIPLVVDSIPEDSTIVICPAVFDADTDNLVVTTYACSAIHGSVTNVTDTCIRYTPTPNWYGTDTICTVVCDPFNACDTNKIIIVVTPRNEPPVADTVIVVTLINTPVPVNVAAVVYDINSDPVDYTYGTPSEPGTVVTVTTNGGIVVTPPAGYTGTITIPYIVCDAAQYPVTPLCDTSIIIVYVIDTPKGNLPPIANDDHAVVPPGGTANIPVLANDYDPNGDPISVVGIIPGSGPSNGVIVTITSGPTPTIVYTPNPGFEGCDTFEYSITDPFGLMDTAQVTVCVSDVPVDVNLPPVAVNDFDTTNYVTPITIPVKINDSDPDGDVITTTGIIGGTHGTATINPNGTVTFSPDSSANANVPGTFCYSICDNGVPSLCDTACVTIYIRNSVVAVDDDTITGLNTPITVDIYGNDFDPENDSFCLVPQPAGIVNYPSNGKLIITYANGDSCRPMVTYQPDSNFVGLDGFCYAIIDAHGAIDTACVTINTIVCISPQVVGDSVFMFQDTDTTISVLNNDIAYGVPLTVTIEQGPSHGTVTLIGNTVYYKPDAGYVGNDYVIYRASGICGSDTAYISYTILPVCSPIEANNDYVLTQVNTGVTVSVLSNDVNSNPTFVSASVLADPSNGVAQIVNNIATYVPNTDFVGLDTFTYISCTRCGGKTYCDSAKVIVLIDTTLCPVPVANDDNVLSGYTCAKGFEVVTNDVNVPGTTLSIVTPPTLGTAVVNGYKIEYTPGGNSTIGQTDVITYSLCNACGKCDTATMSVRVTGFPCNGTYPVAVNDSVKVCLNTVTDINPILNDYDTDGGILSLDTVFTASNGFVVRANGNTVRYIPNTGFLGTDQVVYTVCDDGTPKLCQNGIIYITVDSCVNHAPDAPEVVYDTTFINIPNTTCIPVVDIDGDNVTVTNAGTPLHGTSAVAGDSCIRYTPSTGYTGNDTFTVVLCDNGAPILCDTVTVIYTVVPLPDSLQPPVAVDDVAATDVNTPVVINIVRNDYDPNGDSIQVTLVPKDAPKHGTVLNNGNGTVTYTPDSSFIGLDSFTYTICDNGTPQQCDDATVYVYVGYTPTITAVDEPCNVDSTNENQSVVLNVLANDILVLANDSAITILTDAEHGIASVNANNTVTYFPGADYTGTDNFEYVICLDLGGKTVCDTASVCITIVDTTIECTFPNAFSPNGDGVNDVFIFPCGVKYPDATFRVFNRWGNEVWYSATYKNDWDGTNKEGKLLPDGTYFYIYEYKDGSDRKESRFVVIHR